jgi:hypothetical protein
MAVFIEVRDSTRKLSSIWTPSLASYDSLRILRRWFRTCLAKHEHCRRSNHNEAFVPTRLLKIDRSTIPPSTINLVSLPGRVLISHSVNLGVIKHLGSLSKRLLVQWKVVSHLVNYRGISETPFSLLLPWAMTKYGLIRFVSSRTRKRTGSEKRRPCSMSIEQQT